VADSAILRGVGMVSGFVRARLAQKRVVADACVQDAGHGRRLSWRMIDAVANYWRLRAADQ